MFFALVFSTFVLGLSLSLVFSKFVVMMPKKLRSKCHGGRQRQLKQVHAGLPNAYQEGRSDRACFLRTSASPPTAAGCTA